MTDPTATQSPPVPQRWPPPGLERLQGDLGAVAARAALAGGLLVLPMLFVVAREQGFATLGPLADAWWVTIILTSVGLGFAIDAFLRAGRILRRSAHAAGHGYDVTTLLHVLADTDRDMGFLLQGARHFVAIDAREREALVRMRVFAALCQAAAGLWLSFALGVGLLAAARGLLSPMGLATVTLLPAGIGYAFGGVTRVLLDARVRRARRAYHNQPWSKDLVAEEIEQWRGERGVVARPPGPGTAKWLGRVGMTSGALVLVVVLPVLTLLPTSIAGPVLTTLATPRFDQTRVRAARAEAFRAYGVQPDPAISPEEAGQLLHDLAHVGSDAEASPGEREPSRRFPQAWLPDTGGENPMGVGPYEWGDSLIEVVSRGTSGAQRAYLAQIAAHPAGADFSRLAYAADIDIAGARWEVPFPEGTTLATMPIPRFSSFREGAQAHVAAAAYALTQRDPATAERLLSEVISVGFLVGDRGPTLIDNLIGYTLVDVGARSLEDLYLVTGRAADLEQLLRAREVTERAASRVRIELAGGTETWVRSLPVAVLDTAAVRGIRWEYFMSVTTLAPCLNMHRMVFGPDEEYETFLARAHDALVLFPSEEGLFELAKVGWLGAIQAEEPTFLGRLLSISMSGGDSACGEVIRRLETARAIY